MTSPPKPNGAAVLLAGLASHDPETRYAAFVEADALDDDGLLDLVGSASRASASARRNRTLSPGCLLVPATIAAWLFLHGSYVAAWFIGGAALIMWALDWYSGTLDAAAHVRNLQMSVARLVARRRDPRFVDACATIVEASRDPETAEWATNALTLLLPLVANSHRAMLKKHEALLAGVLAMPLEDFELTIAVLRAYERAGDRLAYVRVSRLAETRNADFVRQKLWEMEFADLQERMRQGTADNMRMDGKYLSTATCYVPDLSSLVRPSFQLRRPGRTVAELAAQLERIVFTARECAESMLARLLREEQASSLLQPTSAPAAVADDLVRPAGAGDDRPEELLRPEERRAS